MLQSFQSPGEASEEAKLFCAALQDVNPPLAQEAREHYDIFMKRRADEQMVVAEVLLLSPSFFNLANESFVRQIATLI